jgi:hypothetical protein
MQEGFFSCSFYRRKQRAEWFTTGGVFAGLAVFASLR